jgi:hypothetical protein
MSKIIAAYKIDYDIPVRSGISYPNFRRLGFRSSGSVWIIPECKMPWSYLDEFRAELKAFEPDASSRARRGKCRWLRFESDADEMRDYARESIEEEIQRLVNQAQYNLRRAMNDYSAENSALTPGEFEERVNGHLNKRRDELKEMLEGAANFDVDPTSLPTTWAATEIDAIEQRCAAQTKAYANARKFAEESGGIDGQAIAAAIQADDIHPGIVADFIDDHDGDSAPIRAAFSQELAPVATLAEDCGVEPTEAQEEWSKMPWE